LSLIFWGWLLGPVGMLLSVPLTIIVKIGLEQTAGGQSIAVLLSDMSRSQRQEECIRSSCLRDKRPKLQDEDSRHVRRRGLARDYSRQPIAGATCLRMDSITCAL
jgi:hypothetical protein